MTKPVLAPAFCQVAWVVKDIVAAEKFFVETMGIPRFMHIDNLAAKDTQGKRYYYTAGFGEIWRSADCSAQDQRVGRHGGSASASTARVPRPVRHCVRRCGRQARRRAAGRSLG